MSCIQEIVKNKQQAMKNIFIFMDAMMSRFSLNFRDPRILSIFNNYWSILRWLSLYTSDRNTWFSDYRICFLDYHLNFWIKRNYFVEYCSLENVLWLENVKVPLCLPAFIHLLFLRYAIQCAKNLTSQFCLILSFFSFQNQVLSEHILYQKIVLKGRFK